ncbi:ParB/Srx family N-terminal domain-containing protein [Sinorhizobium meliloti]|uniref:ParB/Srx family N-terminal domain-containing protein n=1 Tax=Rhizobium meliloti TaxID=382 RepID=UPI001F36DB72|nr:ParB/Srx family N-terminal domain-containing protein [Sinorhizobium meliloti]
MTDIITVALSKMDADPMNVRKTYSAEGIEALAANIRADGYRLLQNLVVRKGDKKGRYFVVAGGRRLAALNLLAEAGESLRSEVKWNGCASISPSGIDPLDNFQRGIVAISCALRSWPVKGTHDLRDPPIEPVLHAAP